MSRPRLPVLVWLALLASAVVIVARTPISADMSAFLPQHPSAAQQLLVGQLREGVLARTILMGIEGADAMQRAQLSTDLAAQMRSSGDFVLVRNGAPDTLERDEQVLFANRYLLSPAVDAQHFSVAGLHQEIAESLERLDSPAGMLYKQWLVRDPTGEMAALLDTLAESNGPQTRNSVWVSHDGRRALMMAQTRAEGSDTEAQAAVLKRLQTEFESLARRDGFTDGRLFVTGSPVFAVYTRATIHSEIVRLSIISSVAVILLLLLVYRSPIALVLGVLPIVSGALVGVAAVSVGYGGVHGLTIGFGTTLIGETLDYSVYYFVQSQPSRDSALDWRRRFWPTVRLGMLTSVCGFASLLFSGFPGLAQLGMYSIAGLLAAAGVTRFVLPVLRPARLAIPDFGRLEGWLPGAIARVASLRWAGAVLVLAALVVLALHRGPVWNPGLSGLSPIPQALQTLDGELRADLGAPGLRYLVVVSAVDRDATLAATERVGARLDALVKKGVITGYQTPARFLPSSATQQRRQTALPERDDLAARLREALVGLPLQPARLEAFLDDVSHARHQALVTTKTLAGTSLLLGADSLLMQRPGGWSALVPLSTGDERPDKVVEVATLRAAIATPPSDGAVFVDLLEESNRLYNDYLREAIELSLAGLAAIALLLAVSLRSLERVVRVLAPLIAAALVVIAGLVQLGERLTLLHLVGTLLIVAVGSNYALFFDRRDLNVTSQGRVLASLLLANLATVIGFGALATSSLPVLRAIGVTVGPGAVLAMLFSILFAARARPQPPP